MTNNHKCSGFELEVVFRGFKQAAESFCHFFRGCVVCFFYLWHVFFYFGALKLQIFWFFFLLSEPRFVVCFHGNGAPGASISEWCRTPTALFSTRDGRRDSSAVAVRHTPRFVFTGSKAAVAASVLFDGWTVSGGLSCSPLCSILFATFSCFYWSNKTRVKKQDSFSLTVTKPSSISDSARSAFRREQTEQPYLSCSTWYNRGLELFFIFIYFILLSFQFFLFASISYSLSQLDSPNRQQLRKKLETRRVGTSRIDRRAAVSCSLTNTFWHYWCFLRFTDLH